MLRPEASCSSDFLYKFLDCISEQGTGLSCLRIIDTRKRFIDIHIYKYLLYNVMYSLVLFVLGV